MHSAIYRGVVWHKRYQPTVHQFKYNVFMMYLDLAEIDHVLSLSRLWSRKKLAPARFSRADYLAFKSAGKSAGLSDIEDLDGDIRSAVHEQLDFYPQGPIRLLTNLRYFGYSINPINCYYCFSNTRQDDLQALLLEVTNTPWGEKTHYVLDLRNYAPKDSISFPKAMHVSPFMDMAMDYQWSGSIPGASLQYTLANLPHDHVGSATDQSVKKFSAGVNFKRTEITSGSLNAILSRYPFMTMKVALGIYWQALWLAVKKVEFVPHPGNDKKGAST